MSLWKSSGPSPGTRSAVKNRGSGGRASSIEYEILQMVGNSSARTGIQQRFPPGRRVTRLRCRPCRDTAAALCEKNHPVNECQPEAGDQHRLAFGNDVGVEVCGVSGADIGQPVFG